MWEAIRETVKGAAKEYVGERKWQKNKPWFHEKCLELDEERKQARQRWLSNKPTPIQTTRVTRNVTSHAGLETKSENI